MDDKEFHIRITEFDAVLVSPYPLYENVWMTVVVDRARASVFMTKEDTQKLIAALQQVIA